MIKDFDINKYLKKGENIMSKINVALIFGGKSGEHEVSLLSTASIYNHINRDNIQLIGFNIDKLIKSLEAKNSLCKCKSTKTSTKKKKEETQADNS